MNWILIILAYKCPLHLRSLFWMALHFGGISDDLSLIVLLQNMLLSLIHPLMCCHRKENQAWLLMFLKFALDSSIRERLIFWSHVWLTQFLYSFLLILYLYLRLTYWISPKNMTRPQFNSAIFNDCAIPKFCPVLLQRTFELVTISNIDFCLCSFSNGLLNFQFNCHILL